MLDIWTCSQPLHDISDISFNVTLNIAQLYSIIPNHSIFCALEVLWCLFSCSCLLPFWQLSLPYWLLEGTRTTFETGMRLYFPYSCVPCIRGAVRNVFDISTWPAAAWSGNVWKRTSTWCRGQWHHQAFASCFRQGSPLSPPSALSALLRFHVWSGSSLWPSNSLLLEIWNNYK